jgi:hypothetical protein
MYSVFLLDLRERVTRAVIQAVLPMLAIVAAGGVSGWSGARAYAVLMLGVVVVTIVKASLLSLVDFHADVTSGALAQILDRAVPSVAGVLLAAWPADFSGVLAVDWPTVVIASIGAGAIAVLGLYVTPPTSARHTLDVR